MSPDEQREYASSFATAWADADEPELVVAQGELERPRSRVPPAALVVLAGA